MSKCDFIYGNVSSWCDKHESEANICDEATKEILRDVLASFNTQWEVCTLITCQHCRRISELRNKILKVLEEE